MNKYVLGIKLVALVFGITVCMGFINAIDTNPIFSMDQLLKGDSTPEQSSKILEKNTQILEKSKKDYESTTELVIEKQAEILEKSSNVRAKASSFKSEIEGVASEIPKGAPVSPNPGAAAKLAAESKK